ncbi:MAG TPA: sulfite exporter TauE/SafE family protein [Mesorhizobium sp.]|jgi:uncharacterized membrane protein YfcA|nr:sulfite exporter TauE/SafE family protein [Mesorhizobium sp.]
MGWGEIAAFAAGVAAAGIASGLLAGIFGIGGGAVLVPVFFQVFEMLAVDDGVRMHLAVGSSLAIIIPTAISSFRGHRARGAVDEAVLRSYLVPVPAGVVLASLVAAVISSEGLRFVFAAIAALVGLRLLFNREHWRLGAALPGGWGRGLAGVVIGFFSTLMGIGGGVLNNTFMTLYGRPMHQAVATSAGVGMLIAIPGALGYVWAGWGHPDLPVFSTGFVNWLAVALVIPLALVFTPVGVRIAHGASKRQLEIGFGLFCLFVSTRFIWSLL